MKETHIFSSVLMMIGRSDKNDPHCNCYGSSNNNTYDIVFSYVFSYPKSHILYHLLPSIQPFKTAARPIPNTEVAGIPNAAKICEPETRAENDCSHTIESFPGRPVPGCIDV